jgi:hypothetical protein
MIMDAGPVVDHSTQFGKIGGPLVSCAHAMRTKTNRTLTQRAVLIACAHVETNRDTL